jgi:hypothetical protein
VATARTTEELAEQHADRADALGGEAQAALSSSLSRTTLKASREAITAATSSRSTDDPVAEQGADAQSVTSNTAATLAEDVAAAARELRQLLDQAMLAGYGEDLAARVAIFNKSAPVTLEASVTDEDVEALRGYPVQGHPIDSVVQRESMQLDFEARGAIVQPATNQAPLADLPEALDTISRGYGQRAGQWVTAAYMAGTQAAQIEFQAILAGGVA